MKKPSLVRVNTGKKVADMTPAEKDELAKRVFDALKKSGQTPKA